ncbi:hypothetical protein I1E95_06515 [Synechococcus sp. CBW1107]|uniref:hypothetical protein n=1 Tax=Synechococcus sp. CBW1107 TaxID=2789857 RepID=UPI0018CDB415|nr:hypothetical protein [Synechococcus sp. CBW1107]QPN57720.1 hypothetical protein I1E95_06515 [Synechococcus sp. CBW1107]
MSKSKTHGNANKFNLVHLLSRSPCCLSSEAVGFILIVFAGVATALDSFLINQMEMLTLMAGLILLLIKSSGRTPLSIGFMFLLVMSLRIYLHTDARYFPRETTLNDYVLVLTSFVAAFRVKASMWRLFFSAFSAFVPIACISVLILHGGERLGGSFAFGELSTQQSALIIGTCLTISLSFLWNALSQRRSGMQKLVIVIAWFSISLLNCFLMVQTHSWAGLVLAIISVVAVVLVDALPSLSQSVDALIHHYSSGRQVVRIKTGFMLITLSAIGVASWSFISEAYSSQENLSNILSRLNLLKCFFGSMFTNQNRFIYGLGFTNTSTWLCGEGAFPSGIHSNNMFAQVAADNGFFAMICLIIVSLLLARMAWRLVNRLSSPTELASLTSAIYCFLFLQVDGGWSKTTFLQSLIGLLMASLTMVFDQPVFSALPTTGGMRIISNTGDSPPSSSRNENTSKQPGSRPHNFFQAHD